MRQKKHNDKRRNIESIKNNQTAPSAVYKRIKRSTKDYKKSNYDNQTNNKDKNRVTGMSIGLEEKKSKPKHVDQKEEKPSSPLPTSSSTLQPEVFDSSRDNAMSEMKEVADMGPVNTSKVFSHVEEKQQLDPSNISINDDIKITLSENNPNTISDHTSVSTIVDSALQERDPSTRELIEEGILPTQDVKLDDITQVNKESEKRDHLDEYSNSPNTDNNNPFIIGIKLWQAHSIAWINAYNEFMKAWINNNKTDPK
jgi:hypothetical protein